MDWTELLKPETLFLLGVPVVGLAMIIAWAVVRCAQINADRRLKQSMLDQGRSADEIERVLAARSEPIHAGMCNQKRNA